MIFATMSAALLKDRRAVEYKFRQHLFTEQEWHTGLGAELPPIGSWTSPALTAGLHILRREDCLSELPDIHCPVLLIHGAEDRVCPYIAAEEMLERLPQAELVLIQECGHVPFLGREERTAEVIRRWWHGRREEFNPASI